MMKRRLSILVGLLLAFIVASCGSGGVPSILATPEPSAAPTSRLARMAPALRSTQYRNYWLFSLTVTLVFCMAFMR